MATALQNAGRSFAERQAHLASWAVFVALVALLASATGAENKAEVPGPSFSRPGGVYTNELRLELTAPGAVIHFSLDGAEPQVDSPSYKGPIQITNCTLIRARAWYADGRTSPTASQSYTLLGEDLLGFNSNLPLVIVNNGSGEIAPVDKSLGHLRVVAGKNSGRVTLVATADYDGLTLLSVRGHSSLRYPKHSYSLKVVNELKDAHKVSLLAMPKESDWVLYGPYPDKTLMRDVLAYELSNQMGRWAPHGRFVEVFVNQGPNQLTMEQYAGVYVLEEKVTRDKNRLNIAKLGPSENREPEITGGYAFRKDHTGRYERKKFDADGPPQAGVSTNRTGYPTPPGGFPADPTGFLPPYASKTSTNKPPKPASTRPKKPKAVVDPNRPITNYVASAAPEGVKLNEDAIFHEDEGFRTILQRNQFYYYEPEADEITPVQRGWLKDYVSRFESALYGPSFTNSSSGYKVFIDSDSFIDYHLLVEVTKNVDGFRFSTFYYKDRGGRLNMGPAWDWNLSFGNADGKQGWMPEHWLWPQLDDTQYSWFRRLFDDPDFGQRYVDRWAQLRTNVFATDRVIARVDELATLLNEAQERNFAKWDILGRHVNPNWYVGDTYSEEVAWMKQWITNRLSWIEKQFLPAPVVKQGTMIELSTAIPGAKIFFTMDGNDPRLPGGAVSPGARPYQSPLSRSKGGRLVARLQSGSRWSAPTALDVP